MAHKQTEFGQGKCLKGSAMSYMEGRDCSTPRFSFRRLNLEGSSAKNAAGECCPACMFVSLSSATSNGPSATMLLQVMPAELHHHTHCLQDAT